MSMRVQLILEAIDRASRPIQAVTKALLGTERAAKAADALGKIGRGMKGVGTTAVVAGGLIAGTTSAVAASMLDTARAFERYEVQMASLEGSPEKGRAAMAWVSDFAARTPLELDQVMSAYAQMKAFGIDPTTGSLQALVDTMAMQGQGADYLAGITLALGQAWSKGKLQGEEMMQLQERGIPVLDLLAKEYGKTAAEIQDMASKGQLGRDAIQRLTELMGSRAAGASEAMSRTWDGMVSNLADQWMRFQLAVMQGGLFDWMKGRLSSVLDTVNRMAADGSLQRLATEIGSNIQTVLSVTWAIVVAIGQAFQTAAPYVAAFVDMVGGARNAMLLLGGLVILKPLLTIAVGMAQLVAALAPLGPMLVLLVPKLGLVAVAIKAFALSLLATPIGWFVAGAAAIAAAAFLVWRNWSSIGPWLSKVWAGLGSGLAAAWDGIVAWAASAWSSFLVPFEAGWAGVARWFAGLGWPTLPTIDLSGWLEPLEGLITKLDDWGGRAASMAATAIGKVADTVGSAIDAVGAGLSRVSEMVFGPTAASVSASASDIAKVDAAANAARSTINAIPPAASAAVASAGSVLATANFHSHGVAMMTTLATGIRAGASAAVEAARETVQQIRDHLPHSPAKTGPLSDLDRVRFGQTLAGAMRAGAPAAIAAARSIADGIAATLPTRAAFAAAAPVGQARLPGINTSLPARPRDRGQETGAGVRSAQGLTVNLTFAPAISGSAPADLMAQLKALLPQLGHEIGEIVSREMSRRDRVKH